jgi:hypothetical protein|tara:strand:+ start:751 stop:960 length:210 start_codon:yes stop_codon:yes gene_type:complete
MSLDRMNVPKLRSLRADMDKLWAKLTPGPTKNKWASHRATVTEVIDALEADDTGFVGDGVPSTRRQVGK